MPRKKSTTKKTTRKTTRKSTKTPEIKKELELSREPEVKDELNQVDTSTVDEPKESEDRLKVESTSEESKDHGVTEKEEPKQETPATPPSVNQTTARAKRRRRLLGYS